MTCHKFTTTLHWTDPANEDEEISQEVTVEYSYYKGFDGGSHAIDPPEHASVEIQSVVPDVPSALYDELAEEAFMHHADYLADAAEYRYGR